MAHAALVQAEQLADRVVNKADDWKDTVVIPRADIAAVTNKPGGALTNGNLVVTTSSGRKVQLHYRRKSNSDFADLYAALA